MRLFQVTGDQPGLIPDCAVQTVVGSLFESDLGRVVGIHGVMSESTSGY
jgi:hypothetical protein